MPIIEEIVGGGGDVRDKRIVKSKLALETEIIFARPQANAHKKTRIHHFFSRMFRNQGTVRPRRNNFVKNAVTFQNERIPNRNSIFKIGESDKFFRDDHSDPPTVAYVDERHSIEIRDYGKETKKKIKKMGVLKQIMRYVDYYFDKTSLHGLRYVGDQTLTTGERVFWLLAFIIAVGFAAYFINSIYEKFNLSPVIISFSPTSTSVASVPFPAVTICSVNVARRIEGEKIHQFGTDTEKMLLDDYCNSNTTAWQNEEDLEKTADWETVKAFILKVTQSCSDMLKVCRWKSQIRDCNDIFNPILTDDGYCCTFNRLPSSYIFRNPKELNDLNETYPPIVYGWTPEKGYEGNVSFDALPFRSAGAGSHLGLTVVLDSQLDSYYCQTTNSAGFKVLLSNPIETPKMADFGFFIGTGMEARIVVKPTKIDATTTLRSIDVTKRQCFFQDEIYLQFYRTYTEKNCKLECQANRTLRSCNCVPYFLPKNRTTRICGKKEESCTEKIKTLMERPSQKGSCNCLPACFELSYDRALSLAGLSMSARPSDDVLRNESMEYFVQNMAVVHFYFNDNTFTKRMKSEIYGFSEFLSNTGGLLGLFLGFSFLSAVELGYYLFLRTVCNLCRSKKKQKTVKQKVNLSHLNNRRDAMYPFMK